MSSGVGELEELNQKTARDCADGLQSIEPTVFQNVVFAGGGIHCFWQAGFYHVLRDASRIRPTHVAAASAGSAIAAAVFGGRFDEALRQFKVATAANRSNAYFENLFNHLPVFPHETMYRQILLDTIDPDALCVLRSGPDLWVSVTRAPHWLSGHPGAATAVAYLLLVIESLFTAPVHRSLARAFGFGTKYVRANDYVTPSAVAGLVLASSCQPPIISLQYLDDAPALDGGITDNVPVGALPTASGPTLILLTHRYRRLPVQSGRVYVYPSERAKAFSWDYTKPDALQSAYELGRRDGETYLRDETQIPSFH